MPTLKNLPKAYRDKLPPNMRAPLEKLMAYEEQIIEALKDPKTAKIFAEDPAKALRIMKVPVDPQLLRKLQEVARKGSLNKVSAYQLPNGQTIVPNVKIRFVKGKE